MEIKIKGLKKSFNGKVALDIENLFIGNGEVVGFVGNNGAGKTTLFRLMLDLLKADVGHVLFVPKYDDSSAMEPESIDPAQSEAWKDLTGAYIDDGFLIDFLTPEEYFEFIGKVCSLSADDIKQRLDGYSMFMSGEILGQKKLIRNLSAGNKQKIGIIAALLNRPQLVILDEPFNFLDPSSQNILKKLLADYNSKTGATILVSSHNLQHTIDISSRIVLLEHGLVKKDLGNEMRSAEAELEDYFRV